MRFSCEWVTCICSSTGFIKVWSTCLWKCIMAQTKISEDLRRVVDAHQAGKGYKTISKEFELHQSTVRQIVNFKKIQDHYYPPQEWLIAMHLVRCPPTESRKMSGSEEQNKTNLEKFRAEMKKTIEEAKDKTPEELQVAYKGILYPSLLCSEATFQALESFEAREDDVLIVTYPKCGTNWSIKILHQMLFEIHNKEPTLDQAMLEFGKPEKYEYLKQQPSPRVLASHLTYENIPKTLIEKKTKILIILRNPKDAAVSYYHFSNNNPVLPTFSSWDLFFKAFISGDVIYGSYFDHALGWEKHIDDGNILVLTFEDMKADLPAELRKISDFYGLNLTDEQIQKVEEKSTFKSMKENSGDTHGKLGNVFFRKGEVGDWKSLFTEEQSKELDAKFETYLAGTKLGEKINYPKYCTF